MKENCKKLNADFMNYELVKFENYEAYMEKNDVIVHPLRCDNMKIINNISSIDILLGLCNLYNKYNSRLYNNPLEENDSIEFGIIDWCKRYVHPNNISSFKLNIEIYNDEKGNRYKDKKLLDEIYKKSHFNVDAFTGRLYKLVPIFNSWYAIEMAKNGNTDYLMRATEMGKIYLGGLLPGELYGKDKTDKQRIKYIKDNYLNIIGSKSGDFPNLNIRLLYDKNRKLFDFGINPNDVFEIAWYTFLTLVRESFNNKTYNHKIMVCENCGDYLIRSSSTKKYCDKPECQAVRNRLKVKAYNNKNKKKK